MKLLLRKKMSAFLFTVFCFFAMLANATINPGSIALDAFGNSVAYYCPQSSVFIYNYQLASGGSGSFIYRWETKTNNGTWVTFQTSSSDSVSLLNSGVQSVYAEFLSYRRLAIDRNNLADRAYSNEVVIGTYIAESGSILLSNGNYSAFVPVGATPPSVNNFQGGHIDFGLSFTYYEWEYRVDTETIWHFINIPGNYDSYQPPTQNTPVKIWYRRTVYTDDCNFNFPNATTYDPISITFFIPISFDPGTISSNIGQACPGNSILLTSTPTTAPIPYTSEWLTSSDSIYWSTIGYGDSLSYSITPPKYFKRIVQSQGNSFSSNVIKVTSAVKGDTSIFGHNLWNVYGYKGKNTNLGSLVYRGYYTDTVLSLNTVNNWAANLSPSYAVNYQGCPLDTNNFTIDLRRKGFDSGVYQLQIPVHNYLIQVVKNGTIRFTEFCCAINITNINLGFMDSSTKIELIEINDTSNIPLQAHFIKIDTTTISTFVDSLCHAINIGGTSGYSFIPLADSSGRIIAAVNPKGANMGTLTVSMKHSAPGAANIPVSNIGVVNMPRYFNFKSSAYAVSPFPNPVTVRLYYLNSEFDDYKIATNQPFLTIADLKVSHYDGINQDCESYNNSTVLDTLPLQAWGYVGTNAFYIDVQTNRFSEFGVSGQLNILPVKWLYANATRKNKTIEINWKVAEEQNNAGFDVLRSNDGISFKTIATIASKGNSSEPVDYTFTDENMVETTPYVYYRIKQTDKDRRYSLSNIMKVKTNNNVIVTLQPNPVTDFTMLTSSGIISSYTITDLSGKVIHSKTVGASNARINTHTLLEGVYVLKVSLANGSAEILKLVKH